MAAFAAELRARGAVGVNLEDGLGPADLHLAKIRAVRAAAPGLFVNARTDTYWLGDGEGTVERVLAYRDAGADGVFVPGLADPDAIAGLVRALDGCPLNVLYTPDGPSLSHLADLGVRRVSLGSLPYRRALGAALDAVLAVREGRSAGEGTVPSYREVQDLVPHRGCRGSSADVRSGPFRRSARPVLQGQVQRVDHPVPRRLEVARGAERARRTPGRSSRGRSCAAGVPRR